MKLRARFLPGRILATRAALDALAEAGQSPLDLLVRHLRGDWGELDDEDRRANEEAVRQGYRILSAYTLVTGCRIWIITEWDRSATTLLLPEES